MSLFRIWRRMFSKPLPRYLFGYVYGSTAIGLLVFFFAPFAYSWKVALMILLASPYALGIPAIEFYLLARERRLKVAVFAFLKLLPILLIVNAINYLIAPKVYWQTLFPMNLFLLLSGLFGSWGGRMIKRGCFGDVNTPSHKGG